MRLTSIRFPKKTEKLYHFKHSVAAPLQTSMQYINLAAHTCLDIEIMRMNPSKHFTAACHPASFKVKEDHRLLKLINMFHRSSGWQLGAGGGAAGAQQAFGAVCQIFAFFAFSLQRSSLVFLLSVLTFRIWTLSSSHKTKKRKADVMPWSFSITE